MRNELSGTTAIADGVVGVPGSGAQPGNNNAAKGKLITDAIMIALREECEHEGKKTTKARKLASTLVDLAIEGNMSAAKEVLNRSDGAVMHSISIDPGQSLLSILDELERRADMRVIEGEVIDNDSTQPEPIAIDNKPTITNT